jgi:hypothetical protein
MKRTIRQFIKSSQQQRLLHNWGTSLLLTPLVFIGNAIKLTRRMPIPVPAQVSYRRALDNERMKGSN